MKEREKPTNLSSQPFTPSLHQNYTTCHYLSFSSSSFHFLPSSSLPVLCNVVIQKWLLFNSVTFSLLFRPRFRFHQHFLELSLSRPVFRENCALSLSRGGGEFFQSAAAPPKPVRSFSESPFPKTMIGLHSISISR